MRASPVTSWGMPITPTLATMGRRFRILGPLEVMDNARMINVGSPRERALLAMLLIDADQVGVAGPSHHSSSLFQGPMATEVRFGGKIP